MQGDIANHNKEATAYTLGLMIKRVNATEIKIPPTHATFKQDAKVKTDAETSQGELEL